MFKSAKMLACSALAAAILAFPASPAKAGPDPFLGELMLVGYTFCPRGWADAAGQLLPIAQNSALFSLYGTNYGGDGRTTFGLPDLRGRVPISVGTGPGLSSYRLGEKGGQEQVTLNVTNMPQHNHAASSTATLNASNSAASAEAPAGGALATTEAATYTTRGTPNQAMKSGSVAVTTTVGMNGGNLPHENRPPFQVMRWCVALTGVFPSRN